MADAEDGLQGVTERFPEPRATERLPDDRATARFDEDAGSVSAKPASSALREGEMAADRFRVNAGPMGGVTGEAEIYLCTDTHTNEKVALKLYRPGLTPKKSILDTLLNIYQPGVVTLRAYGMWMGRFYEAMDYCEGGSLTDAMPFDERDLRAHLEDIVSGLQHLHALGIVHRDIKPNNLMFRCPNRREVVIGDFGVSSILEEDEKVRKTSTGAFFTLDYAAPELIDGKEVSPKTDYYALGVTLIHLLEGQSPFAGMDKNAILGCHFRGSVPRPAAATPEFRRLLNGLLRVAPEKRWGYGQVMAWLANEPILTDDGLLDREEVAAGKRVPYRSLPDVTTPAEMAQRLNDFDVARDLQRGYVSQWAMFFDTELGRRIARLEEEFLDRPELGLFQLRYLLDPSLPLEFGESKIYNVRQLVDALSKTNHPHRRELENLMYSGGIEVWIEALRDDDETRRLARRIEAIRARVRGRSLGLFALLHVLKPDRPLYVTKHASLRAPEEIETMLAQHPDARQPLTKCLFNGYFEEWLRAAFPDRNDDIQFVADATARYANDQEQGLFAVRCRFCPELPFPFGMRTVATPKELAAAIDRGEAPARQRGLHILTNGWLRTWLVCTGRMTRPGPFDEIANDASISAERKLEAILHVLDPDLPWPVPGADVDAIDGGTISREAHKTIEITILNLGRGHLSGTITLASGPFDEGRGANILMLSQEIEGGPVTVPVVLSGEGLPIGSVQRKKIVVDTNGGRLEIPVQFRVSAPLGRMILRGAAAGGIVAALFAVFRLVLQWILPEYAYRTMDWFDYGPLPGDAPYWACIPLALFLLTAFGGVGYYIVLLYRATREETDWTEATGGTEEE